MIEVERDDNTIGEENSLTNNNERKYENIVSNWKLKKTLTFNEILCTAILFLSAGYETTANTLCFISYCLALNPNCQDKLIEEIDRVTEKHVIFNYLVKKSSNFILYCANLFKKGWENNL